MRLSLVPYFGGKQFMVNKLLAILPEHERYIEPFGGAAALLLNKPPRYDVYNDVNSNIVTLFRVMRDKEKFDELKRLLYLTPFSREENGEYKKDLRNGTIDSDVERAYKWYYVIRTSFSGKHDGGFSVDLGLTSRRTLMSYLNGIDKLDYIAERMRNVVIEHKDFREIFDIYISAWDDKSVCYCDPPYVPETRRGGGYECEMSLDDHADLVEMLIRYENTVKFILSGYANKLYEKLEERGWRRIDFDAVCHAAGRTRTSKMRGAGGQSKHQKRVESVWINYDSVAIDKLF